MIHVLPEFKFPVAKIPIFAFVENKIAWKKKMEKSGKDITNCFDGKLTARELQEIEAFKSGMFMISEFGFDHVCYSLSDSQQTETGLAFAFGVCKDFLRLKTRPDLGFTVIVSNQWMFVGVLTAPYCVSAKGFPVYLDGFSFTGLVSL